MSESIVLDKRPQFTAEMTKELNNMLGIETKLSTLFYLQTDGQTECINQKLKQYIQFFIDYRQKDWPEWLALAKFAINNKAHSITKVLLFMMNYKRELRMGINIRRKEKVEKATEFAERMKKMQKKVEVALRKAQEEIKQQMDRERREVEEWKKGIKIILSTKDLVFKERLV